MFLRIIVRDDIKRIGGETTDVFLDAVDAIFISQVYESDNETEVEKLKNTFVASCTKVRKPMVQVILGETVEEL